jgi:hypothetical protein
MGGKVLDRYMEALHGLLTRPGTLAPKLTDAQAQEYIPALFREWRLIQNSPMQLAAPYDLWGFPLPRTAKLRDQWREAMGLTGLDFRLSNDPAMRGARLSMKQRIMTAAGFEPMVPFASQEDAYVHTLTRKATRGFYRAQPQAERLVQSGEFEAASRNAQSRAFAKAARAEKAAGLPHGEVGVKTAPTSEDIANVWRWRYQVAEGEYKALYGTTDHNRILELVRKAHPDMGIPKYWRRALRLIPLEAQGWSNSILPSVEHMFKGFDGADLSRLWRYADTGTLDAPMTGPMRMHDLLVGTGEIGNIVPGAAETAEARVVMETARKALANAGSEVTDPRLVAAIKERYQATASQAEAHYRDLWSRDHEVLSDQYFSFGKRELPSGKVVRELVVDSAKLAKVAPQAAKLHDTLEGPIRRLAKHLLEEEKPLIQYLQDRGFPVEQREWDRYIPLRDMKEVAAWADATQEGLDRLAYARTPESLQAFMKQRTTRSPQAGFVDMVEKNATLGPLHQGTTQDLPPFLTDMGALWRVRVFESGRLREFVSMVKALEKNAVSLGDPRAPELLKLGFQPMPRLAGREGFSALGQAKLAEGQGKTAESLAKVMSRADSATKVVDDAAKALEEARAIGDPEMIAGMEAQHGKAVAMLERVTKREERLRVMFAKSGLRLPEGQGIAFDPDLVEWLVPAHVASEYLPSAYSDAAALMTSVNHYLATNYMRGTVLMSPAFHLMNAIDNFAVAPILAGNGLMFRDAKSLGIMGNTGTAMRAIIADAFTNWPWLEQEHAAGRLATWTEKALQKIGGNQLSEQQLAKYAAELRSMDIIGTGLYGMGVVPSKSKLLVVHNFNRHLGQLLEDIPRAATYIVSRERGLAPAEAKRVVDSAFVNYGANIRAPLDNMARQVSLFWPYTRVRTEQVLTSFFRRPWRLVLMESLQNRSMGQRANLTIPRPLGGQFDIPLGLAPDTENMGGEAQFDRSTRYAITHGLRGYAGYLRGGWMPIGTPTWNVATGEPNTDSVSAMILKQIMPHRGPDSPYNALRGQRGRYVLFLRSGFSPNEVMQRVSALASGDTNELTSLANPIFQLLIPGTGADPNTGTFWGRAKAKVPQIAAGYVPGGRFFLPRVAAALAPPTQAQLANRGAQYYKEQTTLKERQAQMAFFGLSFKAVPLEDLVAKLTPAERKQYLHLRTLEQGR